MKFHQSNRDDRDLDAVRDTLTGIAGAGSDPSPAAVARTWARVQTARTGLGPRRSPWLRRLAVPAAAASVVAVALMASLALRPQPGPQTQFGAPGQSSPAPTMEVPPTTEPAVANRTDIGQIGRSIPLSQVINAMVDKAPSVTPLTVGPGQVIYSRTESTERGPNGGWETHVFESWVDPKGMVPLKIVHDGSVLPVGEVLAGKPNLESPTPQWLATLPTDPAKLFNMFAAINAGAKLGGRHYVSKQVFFAFRTYGPILTPALRAAFFKVLGRIDGGTAKQVTVDGHAYYGILDMTLGTEFPAYLLCDPQTGRVVGERYQNEDRLELWHQAAVDKVGQTA